MRVDLDAQGLGRIAQHSTRSIALTQYGAWGSRSGWQGTAHNTIWVPKQQKEQHSRNSPCSLEDRMEAILSRLAPLDSERSITTSSATARVPRMAAQQGKRGSGQKQ